MMDMDPIEDMDELGDVAENLKSGTYIITDYVRITTVDQANKAIESGTTIYAIRPYNAEDGITFTGTIAWSNTDHYETSSVVDPVDMGMVPAGRLIMGFDNDCRSSTRSW